MRASVLLGVFAVAIASTATVADGADEAEQLFVRRILPLLNEKCFACHGKHTIEGGLDLRSRATALHGGDSGEGVIVEGSAQKSPLILAVSRSDEHYSAMPPKESEKLTLQQIMWLKEWIDAGAPWPNEAAARDIAHENEAKWAAEDGIRVKTSGGLSEAWTDRRYQSDSLWAYQPVKKPHLRVLDEGRTSSNPVDSLLALRAPQGLVLAQETDPRTFIRRATFDLTGLPPTPEEVEAFVAACGSETNRSGEQIDDLSTSQARIAIEALIDRLLESPHYGERMAQHWLDVTRYADSSGFANDYERGNAWRYRDYVVRAFNSDKPYDEFVKEQIAGDEINPEDPEKIIATGFLRMGPWELTGMEVEKIARQRFLDDVVNSVGETFLAHSLQCARCHDHKFDPIPTRDYYSVQAVFATTQLAERAAPFLTAENTQGFEERVYLEKTRSDHEATLDRIDAQLLENAQRWFEETGQSPTKWNDLVLSAKRATPDSKLPNRRKSPFSDIFVNVRRDLMSQGVPENEYPPKLVGLTPHELGLERIARKGLERLAWELDRYEPYALAVYSGRTREYKTIFSPIRVPGDRLTKGELEATCIHIGGDPFAEGAKVQPGVLSVLGNIPHAPVPEELEGRRLAFAKWVAHADNPLTTRAMVNRIWMWHFNQPIAGNPNNFGATGKMPTHPELLDYLAATLVDQGWSIKGMHRLIMTSAAYRRSATHNDWPHVQDKDPLGVHYAVFRPRRLTAEELRDAMLFSSGELNPTLGGVPNRPEIHLEAATQPRQVMGTFAAAWVPNPFPQQRHRRSLYALKLRGLSDPAMEVFNSPSPDFSCERREANTVTPQVFAMFNSHTSLSRSLALASRVLKETKSDEESIHRCFLILFGRRATHDESQLCLAHWREMKERHVGIKMSAAIQPLEIQRDAIEENTGERFSFQEKMHANADFVPDLRPEDCDANTRALADVCLVLFNVNEFAYVY